MARRARENIASAGLSERVEVKIGDARTLMAALEGSFDLIFMDIDKEGYLPALADCHRLLRPAGLLVVDNTGFQGAADFNQALSADRALAIGQSPGLFARALPGKRRPGPGRKSGRLNATVTGILIKKQNLMLSF